MHLFTCIMSSDEMFTDIYDYVEKDGFYVLKGKLVVKKADDVDASLLGANPSAEGEDDEGTVEGDVESGVDIVLGARMKETGFASKKDYQVYMKDYMKNVVEALSKKMSEDEVKAAKTEAQVAFKFALTKFKDLQFYTGESQNADGHIALVEWVDEEVDGEQVSTPYVYFYKIGMTSEKC